MKRNLLQELWLSMLTSMISFKYVNDTMFRIQVASYQVENINDMHVRWQYRYIWSELRAH